VCNTPLIDLRPEPDFLSAHDPAAANIPVEELATRVHELPSKGKGVRVTDPNPTRAESAADFFHQRGTPVIIEPFDATRQTSVGRSHVRLWDPSPFLVESLDRIASQRDLANLSALDIASGTGRDAVYMATRNLRVTAIDLLPDALTRADDLARHTGVTITTICHDLEQSNSLPPESTADIVTVFRYLHRPLFPAISQAIAPGGYIVYETFHERNRETGQRPSSAAHLLRSAELPTFFPDFQILLFRDAAPRDGRWFSSLLARKSL